MADTVTERIARLQALVHSHPMAWCLALLTTHSACMSAFRDVTSLARRGALSDTVLDSVERLLAHQDATINHALDAFERLVAEHVPQGPPN